MTDDFPAPADDYDKCRLAEIRSRGWAVIAIEESIHSPAYAFSAGFHHSFDHAEVLVLGLPLANSAAMIDSIGEFVRNGGRFEAGQLSDQVLEGFEVSLVEIDPTNYRTFLGFDLWLYRFRRFPALQCVWPDSTGLFLWESGADEAMREWQWLPNRPE